MNTGLFSDDFLGDVIIMIIGLTVLGLGVQLIIAGAAVSNYFMTIIMVIAGAILIAFSARILLDLIEKIRGRRTGT